MALHRQVCPAAFTPLPLCPSSSLGQRAGWPWASGSESSMAMGNPSSAPQAWTQQAGRFSQPSYGPPEPALPPGGGRRHGWDGIHGHRHSEGSSKGENCALHQGQKAKSVPDQPSHRQDLRYAGEAMSPTRPTCVICPPVTAKGEWKVATFCDFIWRVSFSGTQAELYLLTGIGTGQVWLGKCFCYSPTLRAIKLSKCISLPLFRNCLQAT